VAPGEHGVPLGLNLPVGVTVDGGKSAVTVIVEQPPDAAAVDTTVDEAVGAFSTSGAAVTDTSP